MNPTVALVLIAAGSIAIFLLVFLLIRFFWLWYWRIDTVVNALNAQLTELRAMNAHLAQIDQHLLVATQPVDAGQ